MSAPSPSFGGQHIAGWARSRVGVAREAAGRENGRMKASSDPMGAGAIRATGLPHPVDARVPDGSHFDGGAHRSVPFVRAVQRRLWRPGGKPAVRGHLASLSDWDRCWSSSREGSTSRSPAASRSPSSYRPTYPAGDNANLLLPAVLIAVGLRDRGRPRERRAGRLRSAQCDRRDDRHERA